MEDTRKPRGSTGQFCPGDWPVPKVQLLPHIHPQRLEALHTLTFLSTDPSYYSDGGGAGGGEAIASIRGHIMSGSQSTDNSRQVNKQLQKLSRQKIS